MSNENCVSPQFPSSNKSNIHLKSPHWMHYFLCPILVPPGIIFVLLQNQGAPLLLHNFTFLFHYYVDLFNAPPNSTPNNIIVLLVYKHFLFIFINICTISIIIMRVKGNGTSTVKWLKNTQPVFQQRSMFS